MAWARFSVFSQRFKHLRLSTLYDILFQPRFLVATYEQRYVKLSDSNIGFEAAWRAFVRSAKVERLIVELVATTFVACVFGCLQTLASNAFSKYLGFTCCIDAILAIIYVEACRVCMPPKSEAHEGFAWLMTFDHASLRSSWKHPPKLLAIPAAWFLWSAAAFVAFILVEAWVGFGNNVSNDTSSGVKIVLFVLVAVQVGVAIAQAVHVFQAFNEWCNVEHGVVRRCVVSV